MNIVKLLFRRNSVLFEWMSRLKKLIHQKVGTVIILPIKRIKSFFSLCNKPYESFYHFFSHHFAWLLWIWFCLAINTEFVPPQNNQFIDCRLDHGPARIPRIYLAQTNQNLILFNPKIWIRNRKNHSSY